MFPKSICSSEKLFAFSHFSHLFSFFLLRWLDIEYIIFGLIVGRCRLFILVEFMDKCTSRDDSFETLLIQFVLLARPLFGRNRSRQLTRSGAALPSHRTSAERMQ